MLSLPTLLRIPNPLALSQWAPLFRGAAVLMLLSLVLHVVVFAPGIRAGGVLSAAFMGLTTLLQILILLSAADLLGYLAGGRDDSGLASRLALFLFGTAGLNAGWFLASLNGIFNAMGGLPPMALLDGVAGTAASIAWVAAYAAAGVVASRLVKLLVHFHEHALPLSTRLESAVLRIGAADLPLLRRLSSILHGTGIIIFLAALCGVLLQFYEWIVPPGGSARSAWQTNRFFATYVAQGLLMMGFAAWLRALAASSRPGRMAHAFPPLLWTHAGIQIGYLLIAALWSANLFRIYMAALVLGSAFLIVFVSGGFAASFILSALKSRTEAEPPQSAIMPA